MKWYFGELIACPVCKATRDKLIIHPIEVVEEDVQADPAELKCKEYCAYLRKPASQVPLEVCAECVRKRITTGVIICTNCGRWYPILNSIPIMLDDKYRDTKADKHFIKHYLHRLPDEVRSMMRIPSPSTVNIEGAGRQ